MNKAAVARGTVKSVDAYIAAQPPAVRALLRQVRGAIRAAVPDADETISYQIPTYKRHDRAMLYFAGWKQHYSLYPATARVVAALTKELAPYEIEKGTIRFPLSARVPARLIQRIARLRAAEIDEREAAETRPKLKAPAPSKREPGAVHRPAGAGDGGAPETARRARGAPRGPRPTLLRRHQ